MWLFLVMQRGKSNLRSRYAYVKHHNDKNYTGSFVHSAHKIFLPSFGFLYFTPSIDVAYAAHQIDDVFINFTSYRWTWIFLRLRFSYVVVVGRSALLQCVFICKVHFSVLLHRWWLWNNHYHSCVYICWMCSWVRHQVVDWLCKGK